LEDEGKDEKKSYNNSIKNKESPLNGLVLPAFDYDHGNAF